MGKPTLTVISQHSSCPFCEIKAGRPVAFVNVLGLPVNSTTVCESTEKELCTVVSAWVRRTRHAYGGRRL